MSPLHSEKPSGLSCQATAFSMRTLMFVVVAHLCLLGMALGHQAPKNFPAASEMIVRLISTEALAMNIEESGAVSPDEPKAAARQTRRGESQIVREQDREGSVQAASADSGVGPESLPATGGGGTFAAAGNGPQEGAAQEQGNVQMAEGEAQSSPGFEAGYLRNPAPAYPVQSRRLGEEGRVLLNVFVESNGCPTRVEIRQSSGSIRLDLAAREAVKRWRFVPARRGAEATAAWVIVPVVFSLSG